MLFKFCAVVYSLIFVSFAQTITQCPIGDSIYTAPDGSTWNICLESDYQGDSTQIFDGVHSNTLCAQICQQYSSSCLKAVFDKHNSLCHLKANTNLNWVVNHGQYDSIRILSNAPAGNRGMWSPAMQLPVVPAGAFIVPEQPFSNRILGYSSYGTYEFGGPTGMTQFMDYNWHDGTVSQRTISNTHHDMFCPGMSYLADGTMVITGGSNAEAVSSYNYRTNSWTRLADMTTPRGYQSSTTLSDGRIFTIGGSFSGGIGDQDIPFKQGEVYDPTTNTWRALPGANVQPMLTSHDAEGKWRTDNHAWLFGWKGGSVFQAGPSKNMNWYTTSSNGGVQGAGTRDEHNDAMCGVNVMFDAVAGKIFSAGGTQSYTNSDALTRAFQITIGEVNQPAQVEALPPTNYARGFASAVVLPNGQVIITGGQLTALVFTDVKSNFNAELWDPISKKFTVLTPGAVPRNYHSSALLLADGRVWVGGSGLCAVGQGQSRDRCNHAIQHFDSEILTPPYLLNPNGAAATRPTISFLISNIDMRGYTVRVGGTLSVGIQDSLAGPITFSLVRLGSSTHSINSDQRRVPLLNIQMRFLGYTIALPSDSGILIPGYYYLFALNSAGVPCVARTVQVTL